MCTPARSVGVVGDRLRLSASCRLAKRVRRRVVGVLLLRRRVPAPLPACRCVIRVPSPVRVPSPALLSASLSALRRVVVRKSAANTRRQRPRCYKEERMVQPALRVVEGSSMDKSKALDAALAQIERAFGKGSIMRLGKSSKPIEVETISTGSLGLDIALGIGGLPRGRVVEIFGPEFLRQDHARAPLRRRGAEKGRRLRLHRRRARARRGLCEKARGQSRGPSDLAARHRRAGARNRRHAGALGRHRRPGDRTRSRRWCRAPNSKARWAIRSPACRRG